MSATVQYRGHLFAIAQGQVFDPAVADAAIEAGTACKSGDTQRNATTLDLYQERAIGQAVYPGRGQDQMIYPAIALAEEAGELAAVVLDQFLARPAGRVGDDRVAEGALSLARSSGAVLGLIKKAYRNEPQGEMTPERRADVKEALRGLRVQVSALDAAVLTAARVVFPPVPLSDEVRERVVKEGGDALWYIAAACTEARVGLGHVGDTNYAKLDDRRRRGVLAGSGDNR
jgi:hypothetical protein